MQFNPALPEYSVLALIAVSVFIICILIAFLLHVFVERPKTPTMRSRIDEKNALRTLNDRLAGILDKKSALEDENSLLAKEVSR